ncbi:hypothetical protein GCM10009808_26020 [Microbacterium sediminicola]|uniref:Probable 2-phosphosulfolactate phosphatase n=1 Tax=Microbacterium sediminicola TaxID=415210 RepID=A0ABP4UMW1_9MICO
MPTPADQSRYQVRLDWGLAGLARLALADVTVIVDALETGAESDEVASAAAAAGSAVIRASMPTAAAAAQAVLDIQHERAARTSVTLLACGETDTHGQTRFCVEDLLASGAVADALAARGIDHTSPEVAAACEAFRGLRGAIKHLFTASASGQILIEQARRDEVLAAAQLDVPGEAKSGASA